MTSEEIRARIAQLEAEAEQRARAETGSRSQPAGRATADDADPWQRLFDTPWIDPATIENDDFSLNAWLAEGLRGLRGYLAAQGLDEEFWGHLWAAEREFLLAWRCLIEARLRRAEEREKGKPVKPVGRQEIEIEF